MSTPSGHLLAKQYPQQWTLSENGSPGRTQSHHFSPATFFFHCNIWQIGKNFYKKKIVASTSTNGTKTLRQCAGRIALLSLKKLSWFKWARLVHYDDETMTQVTNLVSGAVAFKARFTGVEVLAVHVPQLLLGAGQRHQTPCICICIIFSGTFTKCNISVWVNHCTWYYTLCCTSIVHL